MSDKKKAPSKKPLGPVSPPVTDNPDVVKRLKDGAADAKRKQEAEQKTPGVTRNPKP